MNPKSLAASDLPPLRAAADVFDWLHGTWRFTRQVSGQATMRGRAEITPCNGGTAHYGERAEVRLSTGELLSGSQAYLLEPLPLGLRMRFRDSGALFQELSFMQLHGALEAHAEHLCREDLYRSFWRIGPGQQFTVSHAVHGPRKQYVLDTLYTRALKGADNS